MLIKIQLIFVSLPTLAILLSSCPGKEEGQTESYPNQIQGYWKVT